MVEKQVEDQQNKIEDEQTLQSAQEILEYGVEIENKDFVSTELNDQQLAVLLTPTAEEQEVQVAAIREQKEGDLKKKDEAKAIDYDKIDDSNKV